MKSPIRSRYLDCCRTELPAIGAILLFFVASFWKPLLGFQTLVQGDALFYNYPMRTVAFGMLRSGELPLWTPSILSGYPLLSMAQLGIAYPLTWGYLFLPGLQAEKIYVLAPFLLAPVFTYLYIRQLGRSQLASLLGALTFGYGGMMASPIASGGIITNALMWLPLMLFFIERSVRGRFIPSYIGCSLSYLLSVLTGHAESFLIVGLLSGAYALFLTVAEPDKAVRSFRTRLANFEFWRPTVVVVVAGLTAIGLAAFQLLETLRAVKLSVRRTLTYEFLTQGSFTLHDIWTSFTTPIFNVVDMHTAVPPLAAILAIIAIFAHLRTRNRDPRVFFWTVTVLVACVLMMGKFTPFYRLIFYFPLLNLFRVPSRHTAEWTFAAGVLGAYGFDVILSRFLRANAIHPSNKSLYTALALLFAGSLIGVLWWHKGQSLNPFATGWPHSPTVYRLWKAAFVLVMCACLWRACLITSNRARPLVVGAALLVTCFIEPSLLITKWWGPLATVASRFQQPAALTQYLQQFPSAEFRTYTRVDLMSEQGGAGPQKLDSSNLHALWGLQDVAGYEPLVMERYSRALGGALLNGVNTADLKPPDPSLLSKKSNVLNLLNVKFLVSYPNLQPSQQLTTSNISAVSNQWRKQYDDGLAQVLINSAVMPRAWLVKNVERVSPDQALARIRGEDTTANFDPRQTALIEIPLSDQTLTGGTAGPSDVVQIASYGPNNLRVKTSSSSPSFLVLSEIYYPGWQATVDSKVEEIHVADYLLRGVYVPAGQHTVEMRYLAPDARTGAIISLATFSILTLLALSQLKFFRRKLG